MVAGEHENIHGECTFWNMSATWNTLRMISNFYLYNSVTV